MSIDLMWFHPVTLTIFSIIGLWALYLGSMSARRRYLKHKVMFQWKKHVFWGRLSLLVWILGGCFGLYMAYTEWGSLIVAETHALLGLAIMALSVFGLASGYIMNTYRVQRRLLPLAHGIGNTLLCLLVVIEFFTGLDVIIQFIL